jgi:hypothetical protein
MLRENGITGITKDRRRIACWCSPSDHVTNFFYHNAPMFCLAVSDTCTGPAPKELPRLGVEKLLAYEKEVNEGFAKTA